METEIQPPLEEELHLLYSWEPARDRSRVRTAALASLLAHLLLIGTLATAPKSAFESRKPPPPPELKRRVTPLVDPLTELTQRAKNKAKLSKELTAEAVAPRPQAKAPVPAPSPAPTPKRLTPPPAPPVVAKSAPKPVTPMAEPPKVEIVQKEPAPVQLPSAQPPVEKPKLSFENPSSPAPSQPRPVNRALTPNTSVEEAMRSVARSGGSGGQVGDSIPDFPSPNRLPSPARPQSSLELKSDPMGVDFKPYLIRVLATVRRNWFAVMPEAANLGQSGKVQIEFGIAKDGTITKMVYANQSGAKALDQAAVAALSASNPLPPLPGEFKGQRIILQFTFAYNMR